MKRIRNPARPDAKLLSNTVLWTPDDPGTAFICWRFPAALVGSTQSALWALRCQLHGSFRWFQQLMPSRNPYSAHRCHPRLNSCARVAIDSTWLQSRVVKKNKYAPIQANTYSYNNILYGDQLRNLSINQHTYDIHIYIYIYIYICVYIIIYIYIIIYYIHYISYIYILYKYY